MTAGDAEDGTIDEPLSWCRGHAGPTSPHAPHVAACDVDDAGLAGCLQKDARALAEHPDAATRVYPFSGNDDHSRTMTVLATAKQTGRDTE
jgi:hypothetical protein